MDKYLFIHNMNYFDLIPDDITYYIYELAHKSQMKEVLDEHMFNVNNKIWWWERSCLGEKCYFAKKIIVGHKVYPNIKVYEFSLSYNLYNTVTLLKYAYIQKKKEILFYSFTKGVKLYKSWTKKKMIDTLYNEGRLFEVVVKCINN